MVATGITTTVGYRLYAQESDTTTTTSWEYSAAEANTGDNMIAGHTVDKHIINTHENQKIQVLK